VLSKNKPGGQERNKGDEGRKEGRKEGKKEEEGKRRRTRNPWKSTAYRADPFLRSGIGHEGTVRSYWKGQISEKKEERKGGNEPKPKRLAHPD